MHNSSGMDGSIATPLHFACVSGNNEIVERELASPHCQVNEYGTIKGKVGTPLYFACKHGHTNIVALLLAIPEVDPNKQKRSFHDLPLHAAPNKEIAQLLITHGTNVNKIVNKHVESKKTPLMFHLENEHYDIAELLIDSGADVHYPGNLKDYICTAEHYGNMMKTPLFYALQQLHNGNDQNRTIMQKLLAKGADIIDVVCGAIYFYKDIAQDFRIAYFKNNIDFLARHNFHAFSYDKPTSKYNPINFFQQESLLFDFFKQSTSGSEKSKKQFNKALRSVAEVFKALVSDEFPNGHFMQRVAIKVFSKGTMLFLYQANKRDLSNCFGEKIVNDTFALLTQHHSF